ncbi:MAG: methylmalonyl-CoA mutase family protein [Alphaproteobacteria bacterium]|nr:methylmalonyl-CoA mutase family protein [Alphaproteobacteria bacterium]
MPRAKTSRTRQPTIPDAGGSAGEGLIGPYKARHQVRFVTATSLFDGHDAAINVMRRILQASGVEVIHLGHNRSVEEIVTAALQEDAHAIAISSYQGGHMEFFKYMVDLLRQRGGEHIKVFGGGGGVIVAEEIAELVDYGVAAIYSPEDGRQLGLQGIINDMIEKSDADLCAHLPNGLEGVRKANWRDLARLVTGIEGGVVKKNLQKELRTLAATHATTPVLGVTGTGGAGKSSLVDEIVRRFHMDDPGLAIAILAIDPSKRKTGGALLGDRIRMNAITEKVYMRSLATRSSGAEVPEGLDDMIAACKVAGFGLVIVETSGIGQGNAAIVDHADVSLYVMTPEYGAASQLEKIDMLDLADIVAINKFDRKGAMDALRDVRKQVQRSQQAFTAAPEEMPVYGTIASQFNDEGVTALYEGCLDFFNARKLGAWATQLPPMADKATKPGASIVPPSRQHYLSEISECVRSYLAKVESQAALAREAQQLSAAKRLLAEAGEQQAGGIDLLIRDREKAMEPAFRALLEDWPRVKESYGGETFVERVRDREIETTPYTTSLSGSRIPRVALPKFEDHGELLRWLGKENLPGRFPYTAGVFAFKRMDEDPTRMFAGEGGPFRTNERFKYLSKDSPAKRLSTAFDSVTLYGADPDERPDIYGKVGNSGVSIATLDDMKVLYDGFDLCDPKTSVSMTINGPAPAILAMFLNTAIDQKLKAFRAGEGREPNNEEAAQIRAEALAVVRGTVQADILKEDQGQNTCIFSTEFALKMMADIQEYFIEHKVANFYSVSISGYHIAEAGANPITQLAFTLANGFTFVEAYLARGMDIDDFAPNLSFFFSNGMDPEYSVLGRVARRIWAAAMKFKYGANERSQKLKYHVQTSGRSLHAKEMTFNDIRTTLQALIAIYDNCNSLHTNAYDEAFTTPTAESVRRAMAIQMIINREWGNAKNENPNQGAFFFEELTDLVEEAVLQEFERISERGGVLGAMETGYQRGKIQDESLLYEMRKHDGTLPIVGVNTFLNPEAQGPLPTPALQRSTEDEKEDQIRRLRDFQTRHRKEALPILARLKAAALEDANVFAVLMDAVRCCSLGQISQALFEVGGRYRRNM